MTAEECRASLRLGTKVNIVGVTWCLKKPQRFGACVVALTERTPTVAPLVTVRTHDGRLHQFDCAWLQLPSAQVSCTLSGAKKDVPVHLL